MYLATHNTHTVQTILEAAATIQREQGVRASVDYYIEILQTPQRFTTEEYIQICIYCSHIAEQHLLLSECTEYAQRAVDCARKQHNTEITCAALVQSGTSLILTQKYTDAIAQFQEVLTTLGSEGNALLLAKALQGMGTAHLHRGLTTQALEYYTQEKSIAETQQSVLDLANAWTGIGNCNFFLGNYPEARTAYFTAIPLFTELDARKELAKIKNNLAAVLQTIGDLAGALTMFEDVLTERKALGDQKGVATTLYNIGNIFRTTGNYDQSLKYADEALRIYDANALRHNAALVCESQAGTLEQMDRIDEAFIYAERALSIYADLGDKRGIAYSSMTLATLHARKKDDITSRRLLESVIPMMQEVGDKSGLSSLYLRIANLDASAGNYPQALEYYSQCQSIADSINLAERQYQVQLRMGELYLMRSWQHYNVATAIKLFRKAASIAQQSGYKRSIFELYYKLSDAYEQQHQYKRALEFLKKGRSEEKRIHNEEAQRQAQYIEVERIVGDMRRQQEITDAILERALPPAIVARMKQGETLIADSYQSVSILFADIVGFTTLSGMVSVEKIVELLNTIFIQFDTIIADNSCERIKTIGDGYMAICGAPEFTPHHAVNLCNAALRMQQFIAQLDTHQYFAGTSAQDTSLGVRIGLHCGNAIGGVIGEKKLAYDIWGDTVNIASRMESHGERNRIHVSADFKNEFLLHSHHASAPAVQFHSRGNITVKGKGTMHTYFVDEA